MSFLIGEQPILIVTAGDTKIDMQNTNTSLVQKLK